MRRRGGCLIVCLCIVSCSSLARGFSQTDSAPLTEDYKKYRSQRRLLYIQNFENRTYSPHLTGRLKDKLQIGYTRLASLSVIPEKKVADLILYGKILMYTEEAGVFDRASAPLSYNLTIVASFRIRARANSEDEEVPSEQHTIRYTTSYSVGEPMYETRFTAEERMLEGLADRIVSTTYEPENMEVPP